MRSRKSILVWHVMRLWTCVLPAMITANLHAHDPLDCSSQLKVLEDSIQLNVTMGLDGTREILASAGFSSRAITDVIVSRGPNSPRELPVELGKSLFDVASDAEWMMPRAVTALSDGMEVLFRLTYERPKTDAIRVRAAYFDAVPQMRPGWFAAVDPEETQLFQARFSTTQNSAVVSLASLNALPYEREKSLAAQSPLAADASPVGPLATLPSAMEPRWVYTFSCLLGIAAFGGLLVMVRRRGVEKSTPS